MKSLKNLRLLSIALLAFSIQTNMVLLFGNRYRGSHPVANTP
jgi:hypothetical protein